MTCFSAIIAEPVVNYPDPHSPEQGGLGEHIDFAFGFLRRQYLIISFFTLIAAAAGVTYLYVTPPTYTASAKVIIGAQRAPFIQQQSMFADSPLEFRGIGKPASDPPIEIHCIVRYRKASAFE